MSLDDIFQTLLLDHYRHPRRQGKLDNPDLEIEGANPLCGDEIHMQFNFDNGRVSDVAFTGKACAICTASTSMFCDQAVGTARQHIDDQKALVTKMLGGAELTAEEKRRLGDMIALAGVSKLPVRVKCALLVWETWALANKQSDKELKNSGG